MNQSYVKLILILQSSESDVFKIKTAYELIPTVEIDNEILRVVLKTRNETIIRLLFEYASISMITPDQLVYFVPRQQNETERKLARELSYILFDYNYDFGEDELSQHYFTLMKN